MRRFIMRLAWPFALLGWALAIGQLITQPAPAQLAPGAGVTVFGTPTVGNCVQWLNATTVQDAGKTC